MLYPLISDLVMITGNKISYYITNTLMKNFLQYNIFVVMVLVIDF
jgi:hypothetical protein